MMWLQLILCLLPALPPIACFQTPFDQHARLYHPSSLDDCMELATNQVARWKQVYGICISMFLSKTRPPSPHVALGGQSNALKGVVMSTDAQYSGHSDMNIGVTPVYQHKRSEGGLIKREKEEEENVGGKEEVFQPGYPANDESSQEWGDKGEGENPGWLSVVRRAVRLRTRRQHSLAINSALVTLADLLVAQGNDRESARQSTFRQQLLGLGR